MPYFDRHMLKKMSVVSVIWFHVCFCTCALLNDIIQKLAATPKSTIFYDCNYAGFTDVYNSGHFKTWLTKHCPSVDVPEGVEMSPLAFYATYITLLDHTEARPDLCKDQEALVPKLSFLEANTGTRKSRKWFQKKQK